MIDDETLRAQLAAAERRAWWIRGLGLALLGGGAVASAIGSSGSSVHSPYGDLLVVGILAVVVGAFVTGLGAVLVWGARIDRAIFFGDLPFATAQRRDADHGDERIVP